MARTDKKQQRVQKKQQKQQKSQKKERFSNPRTKISFNDAKSLGIIVPQTNKEGNTYHWFTRGRKACWETKMNFDKDGYRFYKWGDVWQCSKMVIPNWAKKRLRKM